MPIPKQMFAALQKRWANLQTEFPKHFWDKAQILETGCWKWTSTTSKRGYGQVKVGDTFYLAHRMSYILTYGEVPPGLQVCHKCDNPWCVRPTHLFAGTPKENTQDSIAKGRKPVLTGPANGMYGQCGERNPVHKLTTTNVLAILEAERQGFTRTEIARRFHVSGSLISHILLGRSWRHITHRSYGTALPSV